MATTSYNQQFASSQAWSAADIAGRNWALRLSPQSFAEFRSAAEQIGREGRTIPSLTRDDFPATSFESTSAYIQDALENGDGFVVIREVPLDLLSETQARLLYVGIGLHLGRVVPQTVQGDLLYSVRDEGVQLEKEYGKPGVRTSKTSAALSYHTDSPSGLAGHTPDYVGLLVLRTAKSGGESALVSAYTVHNILQSERPDLLARLYQPYWVDRRAELSPGEDPVIPVPVFRIDHGRLRVRYLRLYISKGQEWKEQPLGGIDLEALDFLDEVMRRDYVGLTLPAERGDIQIINNKWLLHSRNTFLDHADSALKRHYVRIWLAAA